MSDKKPSWFNHPWVIGIGCALVATALPILWDWIKGYHFSTTFKKIWFWLVSVATLKIDLWVVLILIGVTIFGLILFFRYALKGVLKSKVKMATKLTDEVLDFTAKRISGLTWTWSWRYNEFTDDYEPINALPLCETESCDRSKLDRKDSAFDIRRFYCPKCNQIYDGQPDDFEIRKLIVGDAFKKLDAKYSS